MLARIDQIDAEITCLSEVIEQLLAPWEEQLQQAESQPGWGRRSAEDVLAEVGEGAPDIDAAAVEIDVADAQGGGLAPAQARVAEHQDEEPPGASCGGQVEDLTAPAVNSEDGRERSREMSGPGDPP